LRVPLTHCKSFFPRLDKPLDFFMIVGLVFGLCGVLGVFFVVFFLSFFLWWGVLVGGGWGFFEVFFVGWGVVLLSSDCTTGL